MKQSQRKRQRRRRREDRERGDVASLPRGEGAGFRDRWAMPTRSQLRSLAAAIRRKWLDLDQLDPFAAGVMAVIDHGTARQAIAACWVVIHADQVALAELER